MPNEGMRRKARLTKTMATRQRLWIINLFVAVSTFYQAIHFRRIIKKLIYLKLENKSKLKFI